MIGYAETFPYIPIIGTIANIGLVVYIHILLLGMCIVNGLKKYITLLLPSLTLILDIYYLVFLLYQLLLTFYIKNFVV